MKIIAYFEKMKLAAIFLEGYLALNETNSKYTIINHNGIHYVFEGGEDV